METPYVIIPCAGFGKRFKDEGYVQEKPLIEVGGKRLIDWSLASLKPLRYRPVFVVRPAQAQIIKEAMWSIVLATGDEERDPIADVMVLPGPTQGAACSVLAAAVGLPPDAPVLIMNADQWFKIGEQSRFPGDTGEGALGVNEWDRVSDIADVHRYAVRHEWAGFILTFPGKGPAWSYAVTNGTNRVVHVIEKKQVSDFATVGVYWWRRAADLVRSICAMIAVGQKTNKEFYLAPSFNFLPLSDKNVQIVPVEEFMGLGTPEQVRAFEARLKEGWTP